MQGRPYLYPLAEYEGSGGEFNTVVVEGGQGAVLEGCSSSVTHVGVRMGLVSAMGFGASVWWFDWGQQAQDLGIFGGSHLAACEVKDCG